MAPVGSYGRALPGSPVHIRYILSRSDTHPPEHQATRTRLKLTAALPLLPNASSRRALYSISYDALARKVRSEPVSIADETTFYSWRKISSHLKALSDNSLYHYCRLITETVRHRVLQLLSKSFHDIGKTYDTNGISLVGQKASVIIDWPRENVCEIVLHFWSLLHLDVVFGEKFPPTRQSSLYLPFCNAYGSEFRYDNNANFLSESRL